MKNIIMAKGGLRGKIFLTAGLVHITCALVTLTTFIYGEYVSICPSFFFELRLAAAPPPELPRRPAQ